ncbi:MAG TPA: 5-deoxy-glucuronate isomerase [Jiangellales bacterium]|nr:5-deoxy-glucuronate isomerase [Jiangellales bacterium]
MTAHGTDVRLHLPAGSAGRGPYSLEVTQADAGWGWSSLRVLELLAGGSHRLSTGEEEMVVLPLAGGCTVEVDGDTFELTGRPGVFEGVSDLAYVPRDAEVVITSAAGGRFALPGARCRRRLPARYRPAPDVPVEIRGAGACSRQVNNFCSADSFEADRLIAVEVLTPAGNWSSYPPHKHDEDRPGEESVLEEVYYFEVQAISHGGVLGGSTGGGAPRGFGYHRVYGTDERPIDVLAEVRTGDVVLVPHGWHGPSVAAPGYDLYYLNVMAGPGERVWQICDDPAHAWVRGTWEDQPADPRLPLTPAAPAGAAEATPERSDS